MMQHMLSDYVLQHLDRGRPISLSRQLYQALSQLILSGQLKAGEKLPATRSLAQDCRVSRNTVLLAYEQLVAEGYVSSQVGRGTYVLDAVSQEELVGKVEQQGGSSLVKDSEVSERGKWMYRDLARVSPQQWQAFIAGVPDVSLFPRKVWLRLLRKHWRDAAPELLMYSYGAGYLPLRKALIDHLRLARSVKASVDQVVMISGLHQAISLVALLLADPGMTVWMENPGYWGASTVLEMSGLNVVPIAVDEEGMAPTEEQLKQPPRLIFVTPSHQYPLGTIMSLSRRQMLLEYAHLHNAWIIEDDYDSEFRFDGRPIASLQGLDRCERVIYLGTFSKTLFPGMRLGYMVVPKALIQYFSVGVSDLYREGRLIEQAVLCDFITEGHYATHVRRVRTHYARRQTLLRDAIAEELGADWPLSNQEAGLHLVLHLPMGVDDKAITKAAAQQGIDVRSLSSYYVKGTEKPGLLLGYANVDDAQIRPLFLQLAQIIKAELASEGITLAAD